jgi:hypothetical protein
MEEYNDENEFEDFDNSEEIKELSERMRTAMIEKSVEQNYKRMLHNGFSVKNIITFSETEKKEIIETLQYMIDFYEECESYEKCANLFKMLNAFNNVEDFKPIIL